MRAIRDPGHLVQFGFDFGWIDVHAAGDHQIFGAITEIEEAILIHVADIAGNEEAHLVGFAGASHRRDDR